MENMITDQNDANFDISKLSNVLVIYQGGGYDGCIWEYNAFGIDSNGVYFDIFSSGSMGNKEPNAAFFANILTDSFQDIDIYDVANETDCANFTNTHSIGTVSRVLDSKNLQKLDYHNRLEYTECDYCHEAVYYENIINDYVYIPDKKGSRLGAYCCDCYQHLNEVYEKINICSEIVSAMRDREILTATDGAAYKFRLPKGIDIDSQYNTEFDRLTIEDATAENIATKEITRCIILIDMSNEQTVITLRDYTIFASIEYN